MSKDIPSFRDVRGILKPWLEHQGADMSKSYGKFDVDVWGDGHPVWCHLAYGGVVMRIDHRDLRDLEYAVRRMLREVENALPENYKYEVAT